MSGVINRDRNRCQRERQTHDDLGFVFHVFTTGRSKPK
jgi:hypothetical protein